MQSCLCTESAKNHLAFRGTGRNTPPRARTNGSHVWRWNQPRVLAPRGQQLPFRHRVPLLADRSQWRQDGTCYCWGNSDKRVGRTLLSAAFCSCCWFGMCDADQSSFVVSTKESRSKAADKSVRPTRLRLQPALTPDIMRATMKLTYSFLVVMLATYAWAQTSSLAAEVETVYPDAHALYLDLHQNPELSSHET